MLSSVVMSAIFCSSYRPESEFIAVVASGENNYYDDRTDENFDQRQPKRYSPREQSFSTLGGLLKNQKQLGAGLLGFGALLTVMGMMLFFEGTLLRLGNVSSHYNHIPNQSKMLCTTTRMIEFLYINHYPRLTRSAS